MCEELYQSLFVYTWNEVLVSRSHTLFTSDMNEEWNVTNYSFFQHDLNGEWNTIRYFNPKKEWKNH